MPRHRHTDSYIAVVLEGGYVEAGSRGRVSAVAGSILVHRAYEAHQDIFDAKGAKVLNLLTSDTIERNGSTDQIDEIARLAENDPDAAMDAIRKSFEPCVHILADWPDLLARALRENPALQIAQWAESIGMDPASVSRGFLRVYGITPKRYRLECRAERALAAIPRWAGTLTELANDCGFSDQAHMNRTIAALTGSTPLKIKAKSVQASV